MYVLAIDSTFLFQQYLRLAYSWASTGINYDFGGRDNLQPCAYVIKVSKLSFEPADCDFPTRDRYFLHELKLLVL